MTTNRRNIWVYIASPYTKGDPGINTRFQLSMWEKLLDLGFTPIAPLWSHFQHIATPRPYTDWTQYDDELISRCDVCVRLSAVEPSVNYVQHESSGADHEVEVFRNQLKPVFFSVEDLVQWADKVQKQ